MVGPNRYLGFIMIVAERDERELHSFILNLDIIISARYVTCRENSSPCVTWIKVVIVFLARYRTHVIRYDLFPIYRFVISVLINGNYRLVFRGE